MQSKSFTKTNEWIEQDKRIGLIVQRMENLELTMNNAIEAFDKLQNTFQQMVMVHNSMVKQIKEIYDMGKILEKRVIAIENLTKKE